MPQRVDIGEAVFLTFWPEIPPLGLRRPPRCACYGTSNYLWQADYAEMEMRLMAQMALAAGFEVYR